MLQDIAIDSVAGFAPAVYEGLKGAGFKTAQQVALIPPGVFDFTTIKGIGQATADKLVKACQDAVADAEAPPAAPKTAPNAIGPVSKTYFSTIPNFHLVGSSGNWPDGKEKPCKELFFAGNWKTTADPAQQAMIEESLHFKGTGSSKKTIYLEADAPAEMVAKGRKRVGYVEGPQTTASNKAQAKELTGDEQ